MRLLILVWVILAIIQFPKNCMIIAMAQTRQSPDAEVSLRDEEVRPTPKYTVPKQLHTTTPENPILQLKSMDDLKTVMLQKRSTLIEKIAETYVTAGHTCSMISLNVESFMTGEVLRQSMAPLMQGIREAAGKYYDEQKELKPKKRIHRMSRELFIELHEHHVEDGVRNLGIQCQDEFQYWNSTVESYETINEGVTDYDDQKAAEDYDAQDEGHGRKKRALPFIPLLTFGAQALPVFMPGIMTAVKFAMVLAGTTLGANHILGFFGYGSSAKRPDNSRTEDFNEMLEHVESAMENSAELKLYIMNIKAVVRETQRLLLDRFKEVMKDLFEKRKVSPHFFSSDAAIHQFYKQLMGSDFYQKSIYERLPRQSLVLLTATLSSYQPPSGFVVRMCAPIINNHLRTKALIHLHPLGYYDEASDKFNLPLLPSHMVIPHFNRTRPMSFAMIVQKAKAVDIGKCTFVGMTAVCSQYEPLTKNCNLGNDVDCEVSVSDWRGLMLVRRFGHWTTVSQNICSHSTVSYRTQKKDGSNLTEHDRAWNQSEARIFALKLGESDFLDICNKRIYGTSTQITSPSFEIGYYDNEWMKKELDSVNLLVQKVRPHLSSLFNHVKRLNESIDTGSKVGFSLALTFGLIAALYFLFRRNHVGEDVESLQKVVKSLWGGYNNVVDVVRSQKKKTDQWGRKIVNSEGQRIKDLPDGQTDYETDHEQNQDQRLRRRVKRTLKNAVPKARLIANSVKKAIRDGYETVQSLKTDTEDERRVNIRDHFRQMENRNNLGGRAWNTMRNKLRLGGGGGRGLVGAVSTELLATALPSVVNYMSSWIPGANRTAPAPPQQYERPTSGYYPSAPDLEPEVEIPMKELSRQRHGQQSLPRQPKGAYHYETENEEDSPSQQKAGKLKRKKSKQRATKFSETDFVREYDRDETMEAGGHSGLVPDRRAMCDTPAIPEEEARRYIARTAAAPPPYNNGHASNFESF